MKPVRLLMACLLFIGGLPFLVVGLYPILVFGFNCCPERVPTDERIAGSLFGILSISYGVALIYIAIFKALRRELWKIIIASLSNFFALGATVLWNYLWFHGGGFLSDVLGKEGTFLILCVLPILIGICFIIPAFRPIKSEQSIN